MTVTTGRPVLRLAELLAALTDREPLVASGLQVRRRRCSGCGSAASRTCSSCCPGRPTGSPGPPGTPGAGRCWCGGPGCSTGCRTAWTRRSSRSGTTTRPASPALLLADVGEHLVPAGDAPLPAGAAPALPRPHGPAARGALGLAGPGRADAVRGALHRAVPGDRRAGGRRRRGAGACSGRRWAAMVAAQPVAGRLATRLAADPAPLVAALRTTPQCFVHGDWKAGNLGTPAGRADRAAGLGSGRGGRAR